MKEGGVSWNESFNSKKGVPTQFVCSFCGRKYKMSWARENHENYVKRGIKRKNERKKKNEKL